MRTNYSRAERKNQIQTVMQIAFDRHGITEFTVADIARSLDIKPTQYLRNIMQEMVAEHLLFSEEKPHRPNVKKRAYSLPVYNQNYDAGKTLRTAKATRHERTIKVNSAKGQMVLPL